MNRALRHPQLRDVDRRLPRQRRAAQARDVERRRLRPRRPAARRAATRSWSGRPPSGATTPGCWCAATSDGELRVAAGRPSSPSKVTVTATGDLSPDVVVLHRRRRREARLLPARRARPDRGAGSAAVATVVGLGDEVTMADVVADLAARGVRRLMVEGGGAAAHPVPRRGPRRRAAARDRALLRRRVACAAVRRGRPLPVDGDPARAGSPRRDGSATWCCCATRCRTGSRPSHGRAGAGRGSCVRTTVSAGRERRVRDDRRAAAPRAGRHASRRSRRAGRRPSSGRADDGTPAALLGLPAESIVVVLVLARRRPAAGSRVVVAAVVRRLVVVAIVVAALDLGFRATIDRPFSLAEDGGASSSAFGVVERCDRVAATRSCSSRSSSRCWSAAVRRASRCAALRVGADGRALRGARADRGGVAGHGVDRRLARGRAGSARARRSRHPDAGARSRGSSTRAVASLRDQRAFERALDVGPARRPCPARSCSPRSRARTWSSRSWRATAGSPSRSRPFTDGIARALEEGERAPRRATATRRRARSSPRRPSAA